jgi:sugar/nucleoside kinase (ribokinase family)
LRVADLGLRIKTPARHPSPHFINFLMHTPTSNSQSSIVIGGTIAIDHVKTPHAEASNLLGGSAAYAALAASFFNPNIDLIGIIGHDFPAAHLELLEQRGISLAGVERSAHESFTWSGEYHLNMNERTTHRVGLNVLENWQVKVPATSAAAASIIVLANMSPDNQLQMLAECGIGPANRTSLSPRFVIADTMDLWIEIATAKLHQVLPHLDLFVLNDGEARELAGTSNLVQAGRILLAKGPRNVVIKLGEFGAMLFTAEESSASAITSSTLSSSELFRCSAYPLEAVADPTGAGDSFLGAMAGFLASQGPAPYSTPIMRQAVIQASILASFTCEAFSTRRLETLTHDDLAARLEEFRTVTFW